MKRTSSTTKARASRSAAPPCSPRFTAQSGFAQWWVQNEETNRLIAMCTCEQDCRDIVAALNAAAWRMRGKGK